MKLGDIEYSPAWRAFANFGMKVIMWTTMDLDLQGLENVPKKGPLLIVINHNSFLDPVVPCTFVRSDIFPMAKIEALEYKQGWTLKWYGAFPVRRGAADIGAFKNAMRVLQAGHATLMAPEGTRNPDGILQEPHEGASLVAVRSGTPILPITMQGGRPYLANLKAFRRTDIHMRVGKPLMVRPLDHKPSREELKAITDEMMYALAAMMPPEKRGRFADVETFAPRYLVPYHAAMPKQGKVPEVMPLTN